MCLIFAASGDAMSSQHSSRIIEPILRWLFPRMPDATVHLLVFLIRKCAHLAEYAVLGLLCWRALRKPVREDPRSWSWPAARLAFELVLLYAASDEWHQTFVPNREGRIHDVLIDASGAAAGLFLLWILGRWRKHW
jgi:VanZ family protein